MKRIITFALCLVLVFCLFGCANPEKKEAGTANKPKVEFIDKEELRQEIIDSLPEAVENNIDIDIKPLEEADEKVLKDSALSLGFENEKLFEAFANAIGKEPYAVTQQDVDNVHYIAVGPENDDRYTVYIGYIDYVDICFSDTEPDMLMEKLNEVVMISEFRYDENTDSMNDLKNFKNVEMFEIYNVKIDDVSFIKAYGSLALGYFKSNGITDVSCLSDYNPDSLIELDFTDNDISDWSPLEHIKQKVIVFYGEADGMPITITLEDKINQENNPEPEQLQPEEQPVQSEKVPEFVDENGEAVDFGSLFD